MIFQSGIITRGSGSFGGLTLSHNRSGMYFRSRVTPVNPGTGQQLAVRNAFSTLSTAWQQALTKVQRDAWTTYGINVPVTGKLGDPLTLTGQQMYIRCNTPRLQAGLPRVDDGPIVFAHDSLAPVVVSTVAGPDLLDLLFDDTDAWVNEDDAALLAYGSRQQALSINFFKGPYQFADLVAGDSGTPPTTPASVTSPFALDVGNAVFVRLFSSRADGRLSPVQHIGPTTIA